MTAGSRLKAKGRQAQGSRARVLIAEGGVLQRLPNGLHAGSGDHDGVGDVAGLLVKEKRKTQEASGKKLLGESSQLWEGTQKSSHPRRKYASNRASDI